MKTFLRENKLELFFLGVPVLCLIVLWNVNIYKIWYEFTPWKSYGAPPVPAWQIHSIALPASSHAVPAVNVTTADDRVFTSWGHNWWPVVNMRAYRRTNDRIQKWECAENLEKEWGIQNEEYLHAASIVIQGKCPKIGTKKFAVVQIKDTGEVTVKYFDEDAPKQFRLLATRYLCVFLILSAPIWTRIFFDPGIFRLKPDYDAK